MKRQQGLVVDNIMHGLLQCQFYNFQELCNDNKCIELRLAIFGQPIRNFYKIKRLGTDTERISSLI